MVISKLRKAYIDLFPQYVIYDTSVPIDEDLPELYITIDSQVKSETENFKGGYDWQVLTMINIWTENEKGFISSAQLEEVEQEFERNMIVIDGYNLKHRKLVESRIWTPLETDTKTIGRMTIRFQHWIQWKDA